jgi:hypothetical protein
LHVRWGAPAGTDAARRQTERIRLKGTRFLKVATLCPCVLLFLVRCAPADLAAGS